jgi:hypothetical protein
MMASHVTPSYGFFNGRSQFYQFGTPAAPGANGYVLMAGPLGSIQDPGAKIFAMKRHEAVQPVEMHSDRMLPIKSGTYAQSGDLDAAVAGAARALGWNYDGYWFAATERYMGVYHEVAPKEQALGCASCHEGANRLNFAALGYTPVATKGTKPLCAFCHNAQTASFYEVHDIHVTKGYDCDYCHTFSKAR